MTSGSILALCRISMAHGFGSWHCIVSYHYVSGGRYKALYVINTLWPFHPTSYTTKQHKGGAQRLNWLFIGQWSWSTSHNITFEQLLVTWVGTDFVKISRQLDNGKIWNDTSICFHTHHNIPEWIWMLVWPSLHTLSVRSVIRSPLNFTSNPLEPLIQPGETQVWVKFEDANLWLTPPLWDHSKPVSATGVFVSSGSPVFLFMQNNGTIVHACRLSCCEISVALMHPATSCLLAKTRTDALWSSSLSSILCSSSLDTDIRSLSVLSITCGKRLLHLK